MPKVKIKRKSTLLDMAPMCDMAFLLLTFFILTSNFIQKEVVQVTTPSSISEIKIPETNVILIFVNTKGQVFFGIDGQKDREATLQLMGNSYGVSFTPEELKKFSVISNFGIPISEMKYYLSLEQEKRDLKAEGIPADSANNQLKQWVLAARAAKAGNPVKAKIAIKADQGCPYPIIKKLMNTLQDIREDRYNLITSLEQNPEKINIK